VWAAEAGAADADTRTAHARRFAARAAAAATDHCLQLHGGYGYTMGFPIQRSWRDRRTPWRGVAAAADDGLDDRIARALGSETRQHHDTSG
jgi:alkylation response protein AidB-like acyl-CoA dehydrogenase